MIHFFQLMTKVLGTMDNVHTTSNAARLIYSISDLYTAT